MALLLLPTVLSLLWLWPFATGPSVSVNPWLFSLACAALWVLPSRPGAARWRSLGAGVLVAALLSTLIGLTQFFDLARHLAPWVNDSATGEVFANLRQRNQFASLTNMGLVALLVLVLVRAWPLGRRGGVACAVAAAALLGAGNALALSRTGLLQLVLVWVMAWGWGWRRDARVGAAAARPVRALLGAAALAYAAVSAALALHSGQLSIFDRLADGAPVCSSRLTLWANVLHLIFQKPLLGWGWGNLDYAHFVTLYPGERFCDILDNAHNLPLHIAVELGLPVALLFCGAVLWWVWRNRPWAELDPSRQLAWGVLALIGLHSLLEYPLWYGPFFMTALLCIWLLVQRGRAAQAVDAARAQKHAVGRVQGHDLMPKRAFAGVFTAWAAAKIIAIVLLICISYAAWDYHRISQIYLQPEERHPAYAENTLQKAQGSWLFALQVRFAQLVLTPLTRSNAEALRELAEQTLRYSPEPRVVEKLIEANSLLGRDDEALFYAQRFKRAFPTDYAAWAAKNAAPAPRSSAGPASRPQ